MQQPMMSIQTMNERIDRSQFNKWLGLKVIAANTETLELHAAWRDEMSGNPDTGVAHGGVLAAIIDATASYTVSAATGRIGVTLDMRIDYHRAAKPGPLIAQGAVVKVGRTINTVDVRLSDVSGQLICTGRVVYFLAGK